MWQEAHCPLPKKNCLPAARSPGTVLSAADAFKETIIVARASIVAAGRSNAGMPAAGIPFRITLRKLCNRSPAHPGVSGKPGALLRATSVVSMAAGAKFRVCLLDVGGCRWWCGRFLRQHRSQHDRGKHRASAKAAEPPAR